MKLRRRLDWIQSLYLEASGSGPSLSLLQPLQPQVCAVLQQRHQYREGSSSDKGQLLADAHQV